MERDEVVSRLNDLIETSKDGEKGFRAAAERAGSAELKTVFEMGAQRCAQGANELQALVYRLGGSPDNSGSISGAVHRGWVDVKSAVSGNDDLAVLEEVERGEDYAVERYRNALNADLPAEVRAVVERQYHGVIENHNRVRDLRNRYRNAA